MLTGYASYLISEMSGLSGIMTLFVCGVGLAQYALKNVTQQSRTSTSTMFESIAFVAEGFVFTYLGMSVVNLNLNDCHFLFIFLMVLVTAFSRFARIFILPLI